VPIQPYRPNELKLRVFRGSEVIRRGVLTPNQLRSRAWRRVCQDAYADSRLESDHTLLCEAVKVLDPRVVFAGPSAAYLWGVPHAAGGTDRVHVLGTAQRPRGPKLAVVKAHTSAFGPQEIQAYGGYTLTTPTRTAWDIAAWCEPLAAVAICDALLGRGILDREQLAKYVDNRAGRRNRLRARRMLELCDSAAQSPMESRTRVRLVLAGIPKPVGQFAVPISRTLVLHPDLAWPEYKVALEYEGAQHADRRRMELDAKRRNALTAQGWIVLQVTSSRLRGDFRGLVDEIKAALRSRGWRG
jgi:hypothetical protein